MDRLTLPFVELMEPNWRGKFDFSSESAEVDMYIRVSNAGDATILPALIGQILGYSIVDHAARVIRRRTPAKHPRFPWMRAQRVSIEGIGKHQNERKYGNFKTGDYNHWIVRISFAPKIWRYLEDNDPVSPTDGSIRAIDREYTRYTEWLPAKPTVETIARRGVTWTFVSPTTQSVFTTAPLFAGDRFVRVAKSQIELVWHQVPIEFILSGNVLPTSITDGISKVNSHYFPNVPPSPTAVGQGTFKFPPGTLLMLPPDITMENQVPGLLIGRNAVDVDYEGRTQTTFGAQYLQSRTCTVKFKFLYFHPDTDDDTMVPVDFGPLDGGLVRVIVRGHNLFPLPRPSRTGFQWYTASNNPGTENAPANRFGIVNSDKNLLYPYYDFEKLFEYGADSV